MEEPTSTSGYRPAPDGYRRWKRLALIVALLVPVPFIAIIPIGQNSAAADRFIHSCCGHGDVDNDPIAATLLFAQFSIMRSPSLLALASGSSPYRFAGYTPTRYPFPAPLRQTVCSVLDFRPPLG
jgi:hypothetical protein